jgi:hypothetical protein
MGGDHLHRAGRAVKRADPLHSGAGATVAADQIILAADPSVLGTSFALTGPSPAFAPGHVPVRGDLAHIAMAGKWFVPHYAVPMPHLVRAGGAPLLKAAKGAEVLEQLAAGAQFDVLEVSGGWCWGQGPATFGDEGFVGYVAADLLEPVSA